MFDTSLRKTVMEALEFEPSIDAADIGVAVDSGIVTLTGHVPTFSQKSTAERIVMRIKGVRGVAEKIEVRPVGTHKTADDEIARRASNSINWNTILPAEAVKVKVENGWLTLSGRVEWQYQRIAAYDAVKNLPGVIGVTNTVEIRPKTEVADVKKRIIDAFKRDAALEARAINVDVKDGVVTLSGHVHAWSDRQAAEIAAWSAPGVTRVMDNISIS